MARKKDKKDDFREGWDAAWKYIFGDDYSTKKTRWGIPKWSLDLTRVKPKK